MDTRFGMKEWGFVGLGRPRTYLGMRVSLHMDKGERVYALDQPRSMRELLAEHVPNGIRPVKSPMPRKGEIYKDERELDKQRTKWYRSVLMAVSWHATMTKVDLSQVVSSLAQWMQRPTEGALRALMRVLAYLHHRPEFTLLARRGGKGNEWMFYVDSDLGGDVPVSTRSQTGVMMMCNGMPVGWRSNKQPKTAFSSAAAEIYAFSEAVKDVQSLLWRAEEMGVRVDWPCRIHEDNAATIAFQGSKTSGTKIKRVYNLRWEWVRELRDSQIVEAVKIDTDKNVADLLTKCQEWYQLKKLLAGIGYEAEPNYLDFRCLPVL